MAALSSSSPLMIEQAEDGYRYSIEPFLLADFVRLTTNCRALDVGTGCGIIPLLLATREIIEEIVAVEIQSSLYDLAVKNISRNGASDKIRLVYGDFVNLIPGAKDKLFDIVISNPPYRKLNTGRMNSNQEKAVARHELSMDLESLIAKASDFLKNGGVLTLAYPSMRLTEVLEQLYTHRLFPRRLRFVHGSQATEASIFLIDAFKEHRTDCITEPPLYIYNEDRSYSEEMEKIYASFNYSSRTHHVQEK